MRIGGATFKPGTLERGHLKGIELPDGTAVNVPVIVVNGKRKGHTLFLISTLHGQEVTGIEVLRRVCRESVDPSELTGTIVAIPIGNPLAFYSSSYHTIRYDYQDLNRSFPGDPKGSTTPRLASYIWSLASEADYLIDLHCIPRAMGNGYAIIRPFSKIKKVNEQCFGMAEAFGLTITISIPKNVKETNLSPGLQASAVRSGIPSLLIEMNDWRRISEATVSAGVKGVLNVMSKLGMIVRAIEKQDNVPTPGPLIQTMITADHGGIFHPIAELGSRVRKGEEVALIRNAYGDEVEKIVAPFDSYVCAYPQMENQALSSGDYAVLFGREGKFSLGGK